MTTAVREREITACPVCDGMRWTEVTVSPERRLRRCSACTAVFAPMYAEPDDVYTAGYHRGSGEFGIDVIGRSGAREDIIAWSHSRAAILESVVRTRGTLLDVGCGTGEFVHATAARGWDAHGVEIIDESADFARTSYGVDVRTSTLEDSGFPEHSFDVVSACHVLEHMTSAHRFLRLVARWVRPGGHILIEVPNWGGVLRWRAGPRWIHIRPLEHLVHFTPRTLSFALSRAGLTPVSVRSPSYLPRTLAGAVSQLPPLRRTLGPGLALMSRRQMVGERLELVPQAPARAALGSVGRLYDTLGIGAFVVAVARCDVPLG